MARKVSTLHQPNSVLQSVIRAGVVEVRELHRLSADQLSTGASLDEHQVAGLLREARLTPTIVSANQLPVRLGHVTTFCRRLDELLGGGLSLGRVTELVAPPGGGKTQLCLQACVDACLPRAVGGIDAHAIYCDSEGAVAASRLSELASAAVTHCSAIATPHDDVTAEDILSRIDIVSCLTVDDVLMLPVFLSQRLKADSKVKLIVLDSIAAPFRGQHSNYIERAARLQWLSAELGRLARRHAAAVVITNHVTTAISDPAHRQPTTTSYDDAGQVVPALGASWQHCCPIRVSLSQTTGVRRTAHLVKHTDLPPGHAQFQIIGVGVRDICDWIS